MSELARAFVTLQRQSLMRLYKNVTARGALWHSIFITPLHQQRMRGYRLRKNLRAELREPYRHYKDWRPDSTAWAPPERRYAPRRPRQTDKRVRQPVTLGKGNRPC